MNNENFLIVNKPPSMPIHPCGSYLYNTLTSILKIEFNLGCLYTVHRLDRMTSGLVILSKNSENAKLFANNIENHVYRKKYIALVDGKFPISELELNRKDKYISIKNDEIEVTVPTKKLNSKESEYICAEDGIVMK